MRTRLCRSCDYVKIKCSQGESVFRYYNVAMEVTMHFKEWKWTQSWISSVLL